MKIFKNTFSILTLALFSSASSLGAAAADPVCDRLLSVSHVVSNVIGYLYVDIDCPLQARNDVDYARSYSHYKGTLDTACEDLQRTAKLIILNGNYSEAKSIPTLFAENKSRLASNSLWTAVNDLGPFSTDYDVSVEELRTKIDGWIEQEESRIKETKDKEIERTFEVRRLRETLKASEEYATAEHNRLHAKIDSLQAAVMKSECERDEVRHEQMYERSHKR